MRKLRRRRTYLSIYVPVSADHETIHKSSDGLALGFTDFDEAEEAAKKLALIVTTFKIFRERIAPKMDPVPTIIRIQVRTHGAVNGFYLARLDASDDELATLNEVLPSDITRAPGIHREKQATAKVWRED